MDGTYTFSDFRLDPGRHTLVRDGRMVPLSQKMFDVLLTLVEAGGALVTRDKLAERVWGQPVGDGTLSQHVFLLRRALERMRGGDRYVLTVPNKGYRFIAPMHFERTPAPAGRPHAGPALAHFLISQRHLPQQRYCEGAFMALRRSEPAIRAAIASFEAAIEADPYYREAHAGLAVAHCMLGIYSYASPREAFAAAKRAAERALALDPSSADAHAVLGLVSIFAAHDWANAFLELKLASQLNPHSTTPAHQLACAYLWSGQTDRALFELQRAVARAPESVLLRTALAYALIFAGEHENAVALLDSIHRQGRGYAVTATTLAVAYVEMGRPLEAVAILARQPQAERAQIGTALLAHAYGAADETGRALEVIEELRDLGRERYVSQYAFTVAYAGMGRTADALTALERCVEEQAAGLALAPTFPLLRNVRREPAFAALMQRVHAA